MSPNSLKHREHRDGHRDCHRELQPRELLLKACSCSSLWQSLCSLCFKLLGLVALTTTALGSCDRAESSTPLFELLSPRETGVTFANELPEKTELNILNYLYYYNGGGVAAGDIDNDGLPDLYFTSNLGPDKLYLNKGNYRFEDITDRAGVPGPE